MYTLLPSQKNEILKIIQEQGLEYANFSWGIGEYTTSSEDMLTTGLVDVVHKVPKLIYEDSQFYFQFELLEGQHHCTFSPGREKLFEQKFPRAWQHQKNSVREWTINLKREIEAPDLWAEMEKYKVAFSLTLPEQLLNEPIPTYEAEKISKKLNLLADKIEEQFELTNEQNQFVRSKLNYLADATKRQRSVDWAHTLIGVSLTIAVGLSLAPDKAKELWELMRSLGEFIHLIGP